MSSFLGLIFIFIIAAILYSVAQECSEKKCSKFSQIVTSIMMIFTPLILFLYLEDIKIISKISSAFYFTD